MLSEKMQVNLNEQTNVELFAAYTYLAMASYFLRNNLDGFSHWMRMQAQEEVGHAMKYYTYLNERGAKVAFKSIQAPKEDWKSPVDAIEDALLAERKSSAKINELMDLAIAEKDYATQQFLEWFVTEQVEEEATTQDLLDKLKLIDDNVSGLLFLDSKMGARTA